MNKTRQDTDMLSSGDQKGENNQSSRKAIRKPSNTWTVEKEKEDIFHRELITATKLHRHETAWFSQRVGSR